MSWFRAEKEISSTLKDVCERLANVESKLKGLEIENTDLRNKVLRRIQMIKPDLEEETINKPKGLSSFSPFGI